VGATLVSDALRLEFAATHRSMSRLLPTPARLIAAAKAAARLDAALSRDAELMAKKRRDFEHRVAEAEAR